jgi:hypothetical protein
VLSRFAVAVLGMAILSWNFAANAQFTYSFSDAAQSTIDYTTPSVMPKRACGSLQTGAGARDVTITSATTIAAANGVPQHCRVRGVIGLPIRMQGHGLTAGVIRSGSAVRSLEARPVRGRRLGGLVSRDFSF